MSLTSNWPDTAILVSDKSGPDGSTRPQPDNVAPAHASSSNKTGNNTINRLFHSMSNSGCHGKVKENLNKRVIFIYMYIPYLRDMQALTLKIV